ncbi:hypothetical protein E2C01_013789 [Portunus trituberculatus]|uniref:Uncharacterized protein n=1 Tax=Portunus trituberculatus TaxID=210409 RepID=A0A5B7DHJ2_PORTR|nr:hypothetical protein [Portunus trituberculatus]
MITVFRVKDPSVCAERITEFIFLPRIMPSLFFNLPNTPS